MTKEQNTNRKLNYVLLALLLISIVFNVFQLRDSSTTVAAYDTRIDSMIIVRVDLEKELASTEMELEKYRGISANLDSLLSDANQKIAAREKEIRKIIAKEKDATKLSKKLKEELESLQQLRNEYLEQIDQLITENKALKAQNEELANSVNTLTETNRNLKTTASQLKAEYLKVGSFKKKGSGKFVESSIAKRTNKLEVCMSILDNKIAEPGEKTISVIITEPTGKILAGYSKAEFTDEGGEIKNSTATQKITYTGYKQDVCVSYENDERILTSGNYVVDVYVEGVLVASTNYLLK